VVPGGGYIGADKLRSGEIGRKVDDRYHKRAATLPPVQLPMT
jgi:hypothetical protein